MNNRPEFFWLTADDPRVEQCYALRKAVFVDEQGFENEFDEIDSRAWHLLAVDGDAVLAAARVFFEDEPAKSRKEYHIGRICVSRSERGKGLGRELLCEAERFCREQGGRYLALGAQCRAASFYEKCGYEVCGDEYLDEYCPHVPMRKDL